MKDCCEGEGRVGGAGRRGEDDTGISDVRLCFHVCHSEDGGSSNKED
jgi:hypothetical protein